MTGMATYYKCALQVNSYSYSKFRGKPENDETEYNKQIVEKCKQNNITVVGLADHGSVDATKSLRDELETAGIVVFPGFEIATAEKMHIVCLFPPECENSELNRYLGVLGMTKITSGTETSSLPCLEISKKIKELGGFWYAAHVTGENGILQIGKLQHIWSNPDFIAAQIPITVDDIDPRYKNIINNTDREYMRNKEVALINAKDVEQPDDLDNLSASVLIKMSSPSFQNFCMAFFDSASRIRLNHEIEKNFQSSINHISIYGGYLDGLDLDISVNLATIIGGRGTGKSTLINIIRYAMECEPIGKTANSDFKEMMKQNLGSGSRVELIVTSHAQFGKRYHITRRYNQNSVVSDSNGSVLEIGVHDLFPTIEIYGQNEIMEIARDNNRIMNVVSRLINVPSEITDTLKKQHDKLIKNGKELLQLRQEQKINSSSLNELPSLLEKLKYYEEAGLKDKLGLYRQLSAEAGQFEAVRKSLEFVDPGFPHVRIREYDNKELKEMSEYISSFNDNMANLKQQYEEHVSGLKARYEELYKRWENGKTKYDEQLKKSLEDLPEIQDKTSREIVEEYSQLIKAVETAKPLDDRQREIEKNISEVLSARRTIIEAYRKACDARDEFIRKTVKSTNKKKLSGVVRLSVKFRQNREKLIEVLSKIEGLGEKRLSGIIEYEDFDVFTFVTDVKEGVDKLHEKYNLTQDTCDKLINGLGDSELVGIEEMVLEDSVEIELKVGERFKKLKDLSKGQQCTAILNILLIDNPDPLIIDQPEDNLDNSFIADNLVKTLRENKIKRQYIFATHNANIPVFGDSEQIITMEETEGTGKISRNGVGSIDDVDVRNSVISILEGGPRAFKMREEKYGI